VELSDGQRLALAQLAEIAARSAGALELISEPQPVKDETHVRVELSLATRHYRRPEGLAFRDRERLRLTIHVDFPFQVPWLYFSHKRFLGAPHVQWGSYICLYQSLETEWRPSDGMFGLFERIDSWFAAAGSGTLDPEDAPLHPPVAYPGSTTKFVIKANAPDLGEPAIWLGRAELDKVRDDRFDVIGWTKIDDWDEPRKGSHVAAALLLVAPMPYEYPSKFTDLYPALERAGVPLSLLIRLLRLVALMTDEGAAAHVVIGAPMRRKAAGEPLRQHLTVWELEAEALATLRAYAYANGESKEARDAAIAWMVAAKVSWCRVLENRPEIVHRRDSETPSVYLRGKRVLLLGCGALGSAIAEQAVRAGAVALGLADYGIVKPGLLVRQRYSDADVGHAKADALAERLALLGLGSCTFSVHRDNLASKALARFDLAQWDLIIDATASSAVSHTIERELAASRLPIPLVATKVSAGAAHGSVAVKMPGFDGGPVQLARQAKLKLFQSERDHPAVRAFWPELDAISVFQPEPGCSDPTFTGSAADLDYHAGGLLNRALARLTTLRRREASLDLISAPWLEPSDIGTNLLATAFGGYLARRERRHRYRVLFSPVAEKDMHAEIARIARVRASTVETGGLIFGEIDDAHRQIWIDSMSGPPPDSEASAEKFLCGTAGTVELAAFKGEASGGSSRFVGIWHTHPVSRGSPSQDDLRAMAQLLFLQPFPPRQVVMLIVGFAATRPQLNFYLYHRHDFLFISPEPDEGPAGG
jgi:molybdopterin/thiamine biosynthesis adenylyltransferase/proteasome lid subunit RPN8/RPN11